MTTFNNDKEYMRTLQDNLEKLHNLVDCTPYMTKFRELCSLQTTIFKELMHFFSRTHNTRTFQWHRASLVYLVILDKI